VPLQVSGSFDTDLSNISSEDLMAMAMINTWNEKEGGYLVRHGSKPLRDFGRPSKAQTHPSSIQVEAGNLFERAYPCLYPYGVGGIEGEQLSPLDFQEHIRWALEYHDARFRTHHIFPFHAFSIVQRRQALFSARIQIRRKDFERYARAVQTIDADKLRQATKEEEQGRPISDPAIRLLRKHVHTGTGRVQGSNQSRYQLRSQIWSTSIRKGPPTLWITVNPSDLHDPIAQILAGEQIDLDAFLATAGPNKDDRAKTIANDPYAASKFFHFIIQTMFETLFAIKVTRYQVHSKTGVFGRVAAYFGTVESQGRGTLHLHLLIWLYFTPSADEITALFENDMFRQRVVDYIKANIRAYVPGLESASTVKAMTKNAEAAYSRPPNPDEPDFEARRDEMERELARTEQIHTCKPRRCLVTDRQGVLKCKRRAPFRTSEEDVAYANGDWACKRLYPYVNGWNPHIMVNLRCNNDIKLLTNGSDTRNISFYVTAYAAKKQGRSYNASAVLEKTYAYHNQHLTPEAKSDNRKRQELLLTRLMNALLKEQELAAVMVIAYLMGWGDLFKSHNYTPLYWSAFVRYLTKTFPEIGYQER
jgi:hypothetical protein